MKNNDKDSAFKILSITDNERNREIINRELNSKYYTIRIKSPSETLADIRDFKKNIVSESNLLIIDTSEPSGKWILELINDPISKIADKPTILLTPNDVTLREIKLLYDWGGDAHIRLSSLEQTGSLSDLVLKFLAKGKAFSSEELLRQDRIISYISKGAFILALDDDPTVRSSLLQTIGSFGYNINAVENEEEALNFIRNYKVSLLLADKRLGNAEDRKEAGLNFVKRLKEYIPHTKVLMLTSFESHEDRMELDKIADGYLTKPYEQNDLLNKIELMEEERMSKITTEFKTWNPHIYVLFGPHGVGKTTITDGVASLLHDTTKIITTTSRPRRENEIDGVHHHFGFDKKEDYLFSTSYRSKYDLGIKYSEIKDTIQIGLDAIVNLSPKDPLEIIKEFRKRFGEMVRSICILPHSYKELEDRIKNRGDEDIDYRFLREQLKTYTSVKDEFNQYLYHTHASNEWGILNTISIVVKYIRDARR